ncbi:phosphoethanolamine transferase [Anaerovibrio sp. RM50]|uniref:phosphoethanolamine transferase n=1 Tax=Anaerovibrio sp. RM50 TaxID=1200557 RepID=UPI000A9DD70C|nr:phosphoethanolamine transferase [Anaerovibrio sp. RM50]
MVKTIKYTKLSYLLQSVLVLATMCSLFFVTQHEVSSSGIGLFIRKSIVCAIVIYVVQYIIGCSFFHVRWLTQLFVMVWWYAFSLYKCFYMGVGDIFENEIFIGTYGAAFFIVTQYYCEKFTTSSVFFVLADIVKLLLCSVTFVTLIHYKIYGYPIVYEEMLAVYNTTYNEAVEWITTYVGLSNLLLLLLVGGFLLVILQVIRKKEMYCYPHSNLPRNKFLVIVVMIALAYYPTVTLADTDWVKDYVSAVNYSNDIKNYGEYVSNSIETIQLSSEKKITTNPHTVVMVIGESASRNYMKIYTPDFPYDNTPWLCDCSNNRDFIVFSNAYGCHSLTQQVLENALTEKSQYNEKDFLNSMNIIDVAKKKGYKTYWITNLAGGDGASTFSLVASRADVIYREASEYDDNMLKYLYKINPEENNFIVFHGNGSHASYSARYPDGYTVFHDNSREAEYSNAIRFVDDFLKNVYEYGNNNLNLQAMLYFSDHGENLVTGHGPSDRSFDKVRIPMFIYLGKEFQKNNMDKYESLVANKSTFFTNDMIYNTFLGIINAECNYYDSGEDLSSSHYSHTIDDLYTFGKTVKILKDPFLH